MSESSILTNEQAILFGKIQNGEIEIEDPVMLHTYNKQTEKTLVTGPYLREALQVWISRSEREHSSTNLSFSLGEVVEEEGDVGPIYTN